MSQRFPGGFLTQSPPTPSASNTTGVWTLDQQEQLKQSGQWPPNGPFFIEDLFSTWLYTGTGSAQTITNGIDLAGKGGLVWVKRRGGGSDHVLTDSANGAPNSLATNNTDALANTPTRITALTSSGFSVGTSSFVNPTLGGTPEMVSWTFREQPKFFDVVTWVGNGVNERVIPHSLGADIGAMIIKRTDAISNWQFVINNPTTRVLRLNTTEAAYPTTANMLDNGYASSNGFYTPSNTGFALIEGGVDFSQVNASGGTYVAYLFAHNAGGFGLSGTDNVISCGSYTGTGAVGNAINLGYEAQWVMIKRTDADGYDWNMFDVMRGMSLTGSSRVSANTSAAEINSTTPIVSPTATGFSLGATTAAFNGDGGTYIYIAIRRGPMRTPTTGTSVFYPETVSQAATIDSTNVPFPPDLVNTFSRNGTSRTSAYNQFMFVDRLRGLGTPNNTYSTDGPALVSSSTSAEGAAGVGTSYVQLKADSRNITRSNGWNDPLYGNWIYYFMRRAPGFFDEVCYTGNGSTQALTHNLTKVPELLIVKRRNAGPSFWPTLATNVSLAGWLNITNAFYDASTAINQFGNGTSYVPPTSTQFTVGPDTDFNASGGTYVAYLFASCPGVSKVGSYTGNGTSQTINCGFTGGARFVLIKRTDSTGDWFVWDTARGMIPANDPYLLLNSTAAEVTGTDFVDTAATGFEITSTAPAAINASGGTFIFLAIA